MTAIQISGKREGVGRHAKNEHPKSILLRFPPGLRDRIDAVLEKPENRTSYIQQLIEDDVTRREKAKEAREAREAKGRK